MNIVFRSDVNLTVMNDFGFSISKVISKFTLHHNPRVLSTRMCMCFYLLSRFDTPYKNYNIFSRSYLCYLGLFIIFENLTKSLTSKILSDNRYNDKGSPLFNNYLVTIPIFYVIFTTLPCSFVFAHKHNNIA